MLKGKQIAVIGLVVVMGLLFSLDIKGVVKEDEHSGEAAVNTAQATAINLETVSEAGKQTLSANISQQITELENQLKTADASSKADLQRQLAQKWDDVNIPAPGAFYYEEIAKASNKFEDWLKAGNLFTSAYQATQDSTIQPTLVQRAIGAFQKVLEQQPANLDAKTGLGVAYVSGTSNPMQGIQLLREVVEKDPENINANMNLGLFSMKSGQFAKAVNRFKTVIAKDPKPETWLLQKVRNWQQTHR